MPLNRVLSTIATWMLGALLSLAFAPADASADERTWERFIQNGERALQEGRYASAEDWFLYAVGEAEAIDPKGSMLVRSLKNLTEVYRKQGKQGQAEEVLRRLKALSAQSPAAETARKQADCEALQRAKGQPGSGKPIPLGTTAARYTEYFEKVRRRILENWIYPLEAGEGGIGGQLLIEFGIRKDGWLQFVDLKCSSGVAILDKYALNALKLAQPFPPVPDSVAKDTLSIAGIFTYRAEGFTRSVESPHSRGGGD